MATTFKNEKLTWGIAGRSQKRLDDLIQSVGIEDNKSNYFEWFITKKNKKVNFILFWVIPTFIADVANPETIRNMCENAKIIINCVGPVWIHRFQAAWFFRIAALKKSFEILWNKIFVWLQLGFSNLLC